MEELVDCMKEERFGAGDVVVQEGAPGLKVYVVFEGELEVRKKRGAGGGGGGGVGRGKSTVSVMDTSGEFRDDSHLDYKCLGYGLVLLVLLCLFVCLFVCLLVFFLFV